MARLFDLKQTSSTFQVRGTITGTKGKRFYANGNTKNGGNWNVVEFGVNINEGKSVFLKLSGFPRDAVYYYKRGEKGEKGTTQKVAWRDRKKSPGNGYRLIGVNISTGKDDDGNNINEVFTEWDAVEYLHDNLKDGDSVFIKGNVEFSTYTDSEGNVKRKVDLVPTQISYTQKPVDFAADDFQEEALFDDILIYTGIEKENDENDKPTGRFIVSGYSVSYTDIVPVQFVIEEKNSKLANNIKKKLKAYNSIHVYGKINVIVDTTVVEEDEDDGWGEASKMEQRRMNSPVRREYVVFKADPASIDTEEYSEKSIASALKAIKNAKEAAKNFAGTDDDSADSWDDDDDDDAPWDEE